MNPMVEAEIALVLKRDLPTENVTAKQVLEATDYAAPCLELVDTRFETPRIRIVDTIADNASSALFVLGEGRVDPRKVDLAAITCVVTRNGEKQSEGVGAAVMGSPLHSTAWLANRLGAAGVSLNAGDIVLAGSLVPLAKIAAGDAFEATFAGLGSVSARFA
ncbi:fumarylacetoacetate hydrolase family protein [Stenotrophomonas sp. YIM B06876]|uniref:2-keto-4-pentenoate hydratase n=1 Tax=Stenotrophomonas sp. YIM B06876 TaxID=3060211 RepID=UPI0027383800|nr:fumarylacetoacetate hydrolase family protein [Stenotrophomonas sp. YIM B06876]